MYHIQQVRILVNICPHLSKTNYYTRKLENVLRNFGGVSKNHLKDLLQNTNDVDNAISIVADSAYVNVNELAEYVHSFKV